jgi:hypothetical protein
MTAQEVYEAASAQRAKARVALDEARVAYNSATAQEKAALEALLKAESLTDLGHG